MTEENKVVVITGASSGIGEATAKLLASKGHKVVLAARRLDRLEEIAKDIEKAEGQVAIQQTDVTQLAEVEALASAAITAFGRIDVWVNNAGLMPHSTYDKKKVAEWDQMIDVNIKGVLYGIAAGLPYMREQKSGHYINLSSIAGHQTHVGGGVYSGTKYAVRAISESLRQEEAQVGSNVRVTILSPGAVATELVSTITDADLKPSMEAIMTK